MFTGIIEEIGEVSYIRHSSKGAKLVITAHDIFSDLKVGDSVAVNGVCLTASEISDRKFTADVMAETMRRSNLGKLEQGDKVNLERAMASGGRFGGHIVSGHIDSTGTIVKTKREDNAVWVTVSAVSDTLRYIVEKGSVAIDGISLTVASVTDTSLSVSVIPHTGMQTTLLSKKPGDTVNLECDIVGKYIEKFITPAANKENNSNINSKFLAEHGFI